MEGAVTSIGLDSYATAWRYLGTYTDCSGSSSSSSSWKWWGWNSKQNSNNSTSSSSSSTVTCSGGTRKLLWAAVSFSIEPVFLCRPWCSLISCDHVMCSCYMNSFISHHVICSLVHISCIIQSAVQKSKLFRKSNRRIRILRRRRMERQHLSNEWNMYTNGLSRSLELELGIAGYIQGDCGFWQRYVLWTIV